ncbi:MAG: tetratricopeptide repeat protein [Polyangiales bacterium]
MSCFSLGAACWSVGLLLVVTLSLAWPGRAVAQQDQEAIRASASLAYELGAAAYRRGDYAEAAKHFANAHRLLPSTAALIQTIRAHDRAGHLRQAADLALRLAADAPAQLAELPRIRALLREARQRYAEVEVECAGCYVEVDGAALAHPVFFLPPNKSFSVAGVFPQGRRVRRIRGRVGEHLRLVLSRPTTGASTTQADAVGNSAPGDRASPAFTRRVPLWLPWSMAGLTALSLSLTIASGVHTKSGVAAFEANPTPEALDAGERDERRTNIGIGVTAGLLTATVILGVLARKRPAATRAGWDLRWHAAVLPGQASLGLVGRFR